MRKYPEVPDWWYGLVFAACFAIGIVSVKVFHTGLPVWGYLVAISIAFLYIVPIAIIYAMSNLEPTFNLIAELIPGYAFAGMPVPGMVSRVRHFPAYSQGIQDVRSADASRGALLCARHEARSLHEGAAPVHVHLPDVGLHGVLLRSSRHQGVDVRYHPRYLLARAVGASHLLERPHGLHRISHLVSAGGGVCELGVANRPGVSSVRRVCSARVASITLSCGCCSSEQSFHSPSGYGAASTLSRSFVT